MISTQTTTRADMCAESARTSTAHSARKRWPMKKKYKVTVCVYQDTLEGDWLWSCRRGPMSSVQIRSFWGYATSKAAASAASRFFATWMPDVEGVIEVV